MAKGSGITKVQKGSGSGKCGPIQTQFTSRIMGKGGKK